MIAWLCEQGPEALVVETAVPACGSRRGAAPSDDELDAFSADACWLAHAFIEDVPAEAQAAA